MVTFDEEIRIYIPSRRTRNSNEFKKEVKKEQNQYGTKEWYAEISVSPATRIALFLGRLSHVTSFARIYLFREVIDNVLKYAFENLDPGHVVNEILVVMGLMKCEHCRQVKCAQCREACNPANMCALLAYAIRQPYFPASSAVTISSFVKMKYSYQLP